MARMKKKVKPNVSELAVFTYSSLVHPDPFVVISDGWLLVSPVVLPSHVDTAHSGVGFEQFSPIY